MGGNRLSVVIPVYNEGEHILINLRIVKSILDDINIDYEFILVDDGSSDDTWEYIKAASEELINVSAVRFSRNFGKEAAICAGLINSSGDGCLVMDSDLQHPPGIIPEMIRLWRNEGYDVIEGVKISRGRENFINRIGSKIFYYMLKKLSGFNLNGASDFKLMDSKVVSAWRLLGERNTFFRGMSAWTGFSRIYVPFEVGERTNGNSRWSFFKLFKLAVTAITSFSSLPLQIVTIFGIVFLLGSIILGVQTLYKKLAGISLDGFTTVILLLLIIGSALMISLGIIGTYIASIYDEVKGRPRYIITEAIGYMSEIRKQ
jgi:polyisoprenyl-phosphate glycosyltransferase